MARKRNYLSRWLRCLRERRGARSIDSRRLRFEFLDSRDLLAVTATLRLEPPVIQGTVAELDVSLDYTATEGEQLAYFSLDVEPSSASLVGPGSDYSAFSFTKASPLLDGWTQLGFFNEPGFESIVEFDDSVAASLPPGNYRLGTLTVDFGSAGLSLSDSFTVAINGQGTVIGVDEPNGGFEFKPVSFDPASQTVTPITLSGAAVVAEGAPYTLTINAPDNFTGDFSIDWGDGQQQLIDADDLSGEGEVIHTYSDGPLSPTIFVEAINGNGEETPVGNLPLTVQNVAPIVELLGAESVNEGAPYTLTIGPVSDPGADTVSQYIIDWGDGQQQTINAADLSAARTVTHTYVDDAASRTIGIDLVDEDGTYTAVDTLAVAVANVVPALSLSGAGTVNEGSPYTLTIGPVTDPGTDTVSQYVIDWGDGQQQKISAADLSAARTVLHTYADGPLTPTIEIDLVDDDGTHSAVDTLALTVTNVAPAVSLSGAATVNEGSPYTLTIGPVTDPGTDTVSQYFIRWGDGQQQTINAADLPNARTVIHTYTDGSLSPTIEIDLVDEDGTHLAVDTLALTITNVAPVVSLSGAATVNEGSPYTLTIGPVTDPGADSVAQYLIRWGDGQQQTINAAELSASRTVIHTYTDGPLTPTIEIALVDDDGTHSAVDTLAVIVTNIAPVVSLSGAATVNEGSPYTLTIGPVTDPGTDTVSQYLIRWGDGQQQTINAADLPTARTVLHTYTDGPLSPTIEIDLVDDDGTHSAADTLAVIVTNVAPVISLSGEATVNEGSPYTLTIGPVTDPGTDSVAQYLIRWGDGQQQSINAADLPAARVVTHAYTDGPLTPTIEIDLVDEDGTYESVDTLAITVANADPALLLSGPVTVNEGALYTLTIGPVTDSGLDTVSQYVIRWGDGQQQTISAANLPPSRIVTHTYSDGPLTPTIEIDLVDEDATHVAVDTLAITVANVSPTVSLTGAAVVNEGSPFVLTISPTTDPGVDTVSQYVINWGDGQQQTVNAGDLAPARTVTHVYSTGPLSPTIAIDLVDEDGTHRIAGTLSISVLDVTPVITLSGPPTVNEGAPYILTIDGIEDPSSSAVKTLVIDWGDGQPETINVDDFPADGMITHTYGAGPISVTIVVDLLDDQGRSLAKFTRRVDVLDDGLVLDRFETSAGVPGETPLSSTVMVTGEFTDLGAPETHTAVIDWGDGSPLEPAQVTQVNNKINVTSTHNYDTGGVYTVTLTVADPDGTAITADATAYVTGFRLVTGILQIVGSDGNDIVILTPQGETDLFVNITMPSTGNSRTTYELASVHGVDVYVGAGNDRVMVSERLTFVAFLDGGPDDDHVQGGNGSNILLGGPGHDTILGGASRDMMAGGDGRNLMLGYGEEDLVIGGYWLNVHDVRAEAFDAWNASLPFAQRQATVTQLIEFASDDTSDPDVLYGGDGDNLFFASQFDLAEVENEHNPRTIDELAKLGWSVAHSQSSGLFTLSRNVPSSTSAIETETSHQSTMSAESESSTTGDLSHTSSSFHPRDVNRDGFVTPQDVIVVINALNSNRGGKVTDGFEFLDTNLDGWLSPLDALGTVNFLNARGNAGLGGAESEADRSTSDQTPKQESCAQSVGSRTDVEKFIAIVEYWTSRKWSVNDASECPSWKDLEDVLKDLAADGAGR